MVRVKGPDTAVALWVCLSHKALLHAEVVADAVLEGERAVSREQ